MARPVRNRQTRRNRQRLRPPRRKVQSSGRYVSLRAQIVDALEFIYGPAILSVGFGLFLALADQAHEVMLVLADDIIFLRQEFRVAGGLIGLGSVAVFGWLMFSAAPRNVATPRMLRRNGWRSHVPLFMQGFVFSLVVFYLVADGDSISLFRRLADAIRGPGTEPTWSSFRVTMTVLTFMFVPVALYENTKWCLNTKNGLDGLSRDAAQTDRIQVFFLAWIGRVPLIGAAMGLATTALGPEAVGWQRVWLGLGALICAILSLSAFYKRLDASSWLRRRYLKRRQSITKRFPLALGIVVGFVIVVTIFPTLAEAAGPVSVVSTFVILCSCVIAGLTVASTKVTRSHGPLALAVVAAALAAGGYGGAFVVALGLCVILATMTYRDDPPPPTFVHLWLAVGLLAVVILGAIQYRSIRCQSLAGCNIMAGADVLEPPESLAHLASVRSAFAAMPPRDRSEPIRIVAAQGGGLFAAYHTAYYLAARADYSRNDPRYRDEDRFAESVFAISGVSGGSVGASVFWAIRKSGFCQPSDDPFCYRNAVRSILSRDYLSAALGGLLFRDNFDSFVPHTFLSDAPSDRGHVLYQRLNAHVNDWIAREIESDIDVDLLQTPLMESTSVSKAYPLPLLFLNATDLHSGDRVIHSPLAAFMSRGECNSDTRQLFQSLPRARANLLTVNDEPRDLTVGEAAVLSARFPVVSPPGRYLVKVIEPGTADNVAESKGCTRITPTRPVIKQIADGGYFDNTGLETVSDMLSSLGPRIHDRRIEVIAFSIRAEGRPRKMLGALGGPISGVMAATTARRSLTVARFCERWVYQDGLGLLDPFFGRRGAGVTVYKSELDTNPRDEGPSYNFTLSWLLTKSTLRDIERQIDAELMRQQLISPDPEGGADPPGPPLCK